MAFRMQFGGWRMAGLHIDAEALANEDDLELLPLSLLRLEADAPPAFGLKPAALSGFFIRQAALHREVLQRTGEIDALARALAAAGRAARAVDIHGDAALKARAVSSRQAIAALASGLYGDPNDDFDGRERAACPWPQAAAVRHALATNGAGLAQGLDGLNVALRAGASDAARSGEARRAGCEAADLLLAAGIALQDTDRLARAAQAMDEAAHAFDRDRFPLSWARLQTLRGQALTAAGEAAGDPGLLAEAVTVLSHALTEAPADHSPLDNARTAHAQGVGLSALAASQSLDREGAGDLFIRALAAFDQALAGLAAAEPCPLRSMAAHDRASTLAQRAELLGDITALDAAEGVFRSLLKQTSGMSDPVSWAVTQMSLARVYEAQAHLRPDTGERADAAFALAAALDVFGEQGLRRLADLAASALRRLKLAAG